MFVSLVSLHSSNAFTHGMCQSAGNPITSQSKSGVFANSVFRPVFLLDCLRIRPAKSSASGPPIDGAGTLGSGCCGPSKGIGNEGNSGVGGLGPIEWAGACRADWIMACAHLLTKFKHLIHHVLTRLIMLSIRVICGPLQANELLPVLSPWRIRSDWCACVDHALQQY